MDDDDKKKTVPVKHGLRREEETTPIPRPAKAPYVPRTESGQIKALRESAHPPAWLLAIDESSKENKLLIEEFSKENKALIEESEKRITESFTLAIKNATKNLARNSGDFGDASDYSLTVTKEGEQPKLSRTQAVKEATQTVEAAKVVVSEAKEVVSKVEEPVTEIQRRLSGTGNPTAQTAIFTIIQAIGLAIIYYFTHKAH